MGRKLFWLFTIFVLSVRLHAAGFIVELRRPTPIPRERPIEKFRAIELRAHRLSVRIENNVACTTVEHEFFNPNNAELEGQFIFPLPENSQIADFSMWIDGKEMKAEFLDAEKARRIYADIVRSMRDPALLEYVANDAYKVSIYPLEANAPKKIKLTYTHNLRADGGMYCLRYPMNVDRLAGGAAGSSVIDIRLKSETPLKNIYSPSHRLDVIRKSEFEATLDLEEKDVLLGRDLTVYYSLSEKEIGLGLLAYRREGDSEGYFMASLTPEIKTADDRIVKKDVVLVLDRSGSMQGERIKQAINALVFCLRSLKEHDRFNLVTFSTESEVYRREPVTATGENVAAAVKFVETIDARGGTDINSALVDAFGTVTPDSDRPCMIIFITDGEPTVGVVNADEIVRNVTAANKRMVRLFIFGVSDGVLDTKLLDRLAKNNRGASDYISAGENMEVKISNFAAKISDPVLSDATIVFDGVEVFDVFPRQPGDVFSGSQISIFGRYRGDGKGSVTLRGMLNGAEKKFVYDTSFAKISREADFIAKLWATRKVGYLLDAIRLNGPNDELRSEVVRLAVRYGIVTPYTSYLVTEDAPLRRGRGGAVPPGDIHVTGGGGAGGGFGIRNREYDRKTAAAAKGMADGRSKEAARASVDIADMKEAAGEEYDNAFEHKKTYLVVNGRTFYRSGERWIDSEYRTGTETLKVAYLSDEYFELIGKLPELGRFFRIGKLLIVKFGDKFYEVVE